MDDRPAQAADIVSRIKAACPPEAHDLTTAEGRRDLDNRLRAQMAAIGDRWLRAHAAEMIREWREELFGWHRRPRGTWSEIRQLRRPDRDDDLAVRLAEAEAQIGALQDDMAALEKRLKDQIDALFRIAGVAGAG